MRSITSLGLLLSFLGCSTFSRHEIADRNKPKQAELEKSMSSFDFKKSVEVANSLEGDGDDVALKVDSRGQMTAISFQRENLIKYIKLLETSVENSKKQCEPLSVDVASFNAASKCYTKKEEEVSLEDEENSNEFKSNNTDKAGQTSMILGRMRFYGPCPWRGSDYPLSDLLRCYLGTRATELQNQANELYRNQLEEKATIEAKAEVARLKQREESGEALLEKFCGWVHSRDYANEIIASEKKIGETSGFVDPKRLRDHGQLKVQSEHWMQVGQEEYQKRFGKSLTPAQCSR